MAFRADESARSGHEEVEAYLVSRHIEPDRRAHSREILQTIIDSVGPVVDAYPTWHPLLVGSQNSRFPATTPSNRCGYEGLDHTRYFAHGFITCPYGDGQEVIDSVDRLPRHPVANITAERVDAQLYNPQTTPILVRCNWERPLDNDGMVPLPIALPLILEKEVPCWRKAEVAESWETMRPYFLGRPHGMRSSLFVSEKTGQALKKIWNDIIYTGMFGPIKV